MRLILASASPQRRDILTSLGVTFTIRAPGVEEATSGPPLEVARENARRKALAAQAAAGELVLAVDTVVALGDELWGKPPDAATAHETLRCLSGRTHQVISGFAVARGPSIEVGHEITDVTFRTLDEPTVAWYVDQHEWEGRAGAYAIQGRGALLVERIEGDYLNVVGLPVVALSGVWPLVHGTRT